MVRVPRLPFWPFVCASLHRKCAQHRNVRRVILLYRLLAGYSGVNMGVPPALLQAVPVPLVSFGVTFRHRITVLLLYLCIAQTCLVRAFGADASLEFLAFGSSFPK